MGCACRIDALLLEIMAHPEFVRQGSVLKISYMEMKSVTKADFFWGSKLLLYTTHNLLYLCRICIHDTHIF